MAPTLEELRAHVAARYERLDLPVWSDPHPDLAPPREEEYSRVTDPGRYRVVHARARVWTQVLVEHLGARAENLTPTPPGAADGPAFDRGVRLSPPRPDALPLVLLERDAPTGPGRPTLSVLEAAVSRPDATVEVQPDCGCDACDTGSGDLLEAVDTVIGQVVGGPFVLLRGRRWHAQWHPERRQAGGEGRGPDLDAMMDLCRRLADGERVRLPRDTEAFVGRSWLG